MFCLYILIFYEQQIYHFFYSGKISKQNLITTMINLEPYKISKLQLLEPFFHQQQHN